MIRLNLYLKIFYILSIHTIIPQHRHQNLPISPTLHHCHFITSSIIWPSMKPNGSTGSSFSSMLVATYAFGPS
jgi:hypothetical protein